MMSKDGTRLTAAKTLAERRATVRKSSTSRLAQTLRLGTPASKRALGGWQKAYIQGR